MHKTQIVYKKVTGSYKNAQNQVIYTYTEYEIEAGIDDITNSEFVSAQSLASNLSIGIIYLPPGTAVHQRDLFIIPTGFTNTDGVTAETRTYSVAKLPPVKVPPLFAPAGLVDIFATEVTIKG